MQINSSGYSFISMYQSYPSYHGASDISYNFFNQWPNKNKILIQITKSKINKKKISNINKKNNLLGVLMNIFVAAFKIKKFLNKYEKRYLIIEGASWVGFSLILILLIKILLRNVTILYHAHNLEFEVRKLKNNFIIAFLTFYFEKFIYKTCIGTSVSLKDKKFIHKNYNAKSILFENGVTEIKEEKIIDEKIKKNKFILFCGSYTYWPNKLAINLIIKNKYIFKRIFPNVKIILTGEGIPNYKDKNILNLGIVKKTKLWLIKNCLFYAPMPKAPGTKIKILKFYITMRLLYVVNMQLLE